MFDTIEFCDSLLPKDRPRYLMGVGRPTDIVKAIRRGVDMFDCVMPTRNGRNGQIFTSNGTINITNEKYKDDHSFIDEDSNHAFGRMFTKAYIRHLFGVKEILGLRIASTLNLSFYISLIKKSRVIHLGEFDSWSSSWLNEMKYHKRHVMTKMKVRVIDAYVYRKTMEGIEFLILKRAKTKIYEHLWQGVAGKIEEGEKAWEAAIRELEKKLLRPLKVFIADHVVVFMKSMVID